MNPLETAMPIIDRLADHLGMASAHLWPQLVRYTWANALGTLLVVGTSIVLVTTTLTWVWVVLAPKFEDNDEGAQVIIRFFSAAVAATIVAGLLSMLPGLLATLIAPEAATALDILKHLK